MRFIRNSVYFTFFYLVLAAVSKLFVMVFVCPHHGLEKYMSNETDVFTFLFFETCMLQPAFSSPSLRYVVIVIQLHMCNITQQNLHGL